MYTEKIKSNVGVVERMTTLLRGYEMSEECRNALETALKIYTSQMEDEEAAIKTKRDEWTERLGKYYKLLSDVDEIHIYPYMIVPGNNTLWGLFVFTNDSYKGGITDTNTEITPFMYKDYDIVEETKEDFIKAANESNGHVLERRLRREKDKKGGTYRYNGKISY